MKAKNTAIVNSVAASASIATSEAGFLPGMTAVCDIYSTDGAFAGTAQWQTSADGTTWGNQGTSFVSTAGAFNRQNITLSNFIRLNVSARTAGAVQGSIVSDID